MNPALTVVAVVMLIAAGCGGGSTSSPGPVAGSTTAASSTSGPSVPTSAGTSPAIRIDWKTLDACSLIDLQTVRDLTGESVNFATQGRRDASGSSCFWGATVAGVGAYVELSFVNGYAGGLSSVGFTSNGTRCTADVAVAGVGTEAMGGSCTANGQRKVYLYAVFQGGAGQLLVNASKRALEPGDLGATVKALLLKLN